MAAADNLKSKTWNMENTGADRMAYMTINDKNCNLPIVDKKNCKKKSCIKVILPTITSYKCQRDAE